MHLDQTAEPGRKRAQGRPLGVLASWLAMGPHVETKADHWNKDLWPSRQQRVEAREALAETPGGDVLLEQERPQEAGEEAEPDERP